MQLFERDTHLDQLDGMIAECRSGQGRVALMDGVAASGRTALLDAAAGRAEEAGVLVMRATCSPMERELPGSVLSQLLLSVPAAAGAELAGQARLATPDCHDFCTGILRLAGRGPLAIAVDDVHDADPESVHCLLYLARRLAAAPVLVLLTYRREGERAPAVLAREPRMCRLGVEPLSEAATHRLVAARLGASRPELATELHRLSGGNPALLGALVGDYRDGGEAGQGYGAAVAGLVRRGDERQRRVAAALAVLGDHGLPDRAAALAGVGDDGTGDDGDGDSGDAAGGGAGGAVERTVASLTSSGLLRDGRFPHPAGRRAVLRTVAGSERGGLHQRAAKLLHESGEPAAAVADHLARAGRRADTWAVPVLVAAAEQALLEDRNQCAARYLELAHESSRQPAERAAILEKLAAAQWRSSPAIAARNLTPLVAAAKAGNLEDPAAAEVVRQLLWHGRLEEAGTVLDQLRAAAGEPERAAELRHLETWLAFSYPPFARRGGGGRPADPPVTAAGTDPWLACAASLSELLLRGSPPAGPPPTARQPGWVEQALHNLRPQGNPPWAEESAVLALLGLLAADRTGLALEWCDRLTATADPEASPTWRALVTGLRAEAALRRGDLAGAARGAREALTLLPPHAWGVAIGLPRGTLATAAVRLGDLDEAAAQLAYSPPEAMFRSHYALHYLHARGEYHLATQRGYAGLADFLACGDLVRSFGLDAAVTVPWRTGAARAWLQLGKPDRARRLVHEELARSGAATGSNRAGTLRLLAAVSEPDRRPQLLLEAVELFEECGDQYGQARVLADLGGAYSELGDSRRARTTLRRARHLATLCEAAPLCADLLAVQEHAEAPRHEDVALLTDSERRVAHLAVLGYTNREIAAKLYVTASTVEQHLTRVYRKLEVKQRRDLPADLGTNGPARPERRGDRGRQPVAARRSAS